MAADENAPVTLWLQSLQAGDDQAATDLWKHFVGRLRKALKQRIQRDTRRAYADEDAAQSAFRSLYRGLADGRFADLEDRDSLWRMLLSIASHKVQNRHRFDQAQRRDVRRTASDSTLLRDREPLASVEEASSFEPSPEFTAEFVDTYEAMMEQLGDDTLRRVVALRLEGFGVIEIAQQLGCTRKTVQRKLEIIRRTWKNGEAGDVSTDSSR